jgi:arylformamidase
MKQDAQYFETRYNPRLAVPEYASHFEAWGQRSADARARMDGYLDVSYGNHPLEKLDVFRAKGASRALLMFIHGGYWRALDKSQHSFVAEPFANAGVTVGMINYALCPAVTVEEIVRQVLQAAAWLYRNASNFGAPAGPIFVAGHSAGGHLTAMLMAALWPTFDRSLPKDLWKGGLAISGLYDLRPLVDVDWLNGDLRLDEASALRLSPAFLPPATRAAVMTCVGGDESSEFLRQNALLASRWKSVFAGDIAMPGRNHFSVIDALAEQTSALFAGARKLMKLDR